MGHSTGDAVIVAALTAGVLGYLFLKFQERRRRLEVLHAERLASRHAKPPNPHATLIIGIVLAAFGFGSMIALLMIDEFRTVWPMPLPVVFMGLGLVLFYVLTRPASSSRRGN
jgi:H+/Cl- antiporter ClcA